MNLPKLKPDIKKKLAAHNFSTAEFIKEARKIHKDRYSYDKTRFKDHKTKVSIRCQVHGVFEQMPENHLRGRGCPTCGILSTSDKTRLTTKQFIKKARKIHGDRYSYEKAVYRNNSTPIEIICPRHGSFFQRPAQHFVGSGCSLCSHERGADAIRKTTEQFIKEARKVHGERYSYRRVDYKNDKTKVIIECHLHGEFGQIPGNHLKGNGCPICGKLQRPISKRRTTKLFIEAARKVHNDFYSYEKTLYRTAVEAVDIICPKHGVFSQSADNHLSGQGCPQCGLLRLADHFRKPYEQFVKEARAVHGNRYAYHKVQYKTIATPVTIVCQIHGEFEQKPYDHIQGVGCQDCRKELDRLKRQEHFIRQAKELHGNRYGYQLVHYKNARTHITIVCPIHGPFKQRPDGHLEGKHCLKCHLDLVKRGYYKGRGGPKSLKF